MFRIHYLKSVSRLVASFAMVLMAVTLSTGASFAQSVTANEAKTRVNIAGRERMLIQRVVKSACFSSLGIERSRNREELVAAQDLFAQSLDALQVGNPAVGLGPETSEELLADFAAIEAGWSEVTSLAGAAISPMGISLEGLHSLDVVGLDLLEKENAVVQKITQVYGQHLDDLPLILSISIDVAGRQRMLSQKMAKEFCLIDAGVNRDENRARLAQSIQVFNSTLSGLQSGLPGMVISAPNYDIRQKLRETARFWAPVNIALQAVADGAEITDEDRAVVVNNMEAVLVAMNEAVGMYEYVNAVP